MPLDPGHRLGPYEIVSPLGAGGMGEVYRARDTRLKRDVAIKVLPADVANDHERLARFQREAEVLASLNHPHIAHVYGIEERALVMELVEGEDLSQRIARGAIPIDEALPIARQIAEALDAAHDHGIVHRDLKPANIKVADDGGVTVLDFGLAKALGPSEGDGFRRRQAEADASALQTITSPAMTMHGVILGTAAYMSPEQAKGRPVDRRSDLWAFGCVLYEMLSGQRAFHGEDVTEVMAAVVRAEPDWTTLPAATPPSVRALLELCLQKERAKRASSIGVVKLLLDPPPAMLAPAGPAPARRRSWTALAAVAGIALGAAAGITAYRWTRTPPAATFPVRFTIEPDTAPRTGSGRDLSISSDGSRIAFINNSGSLSIRSLADLTSKPLAGSEGGRYPFFSPDAAWVGFVDLSGALKKVSTGGGGAVVIAPLAATLRGATWLGRRQHRVRDQRPRDRTDAGAG